MRLKDQFPMVGHVDIYETTLDGIKNLLYSDSNQIQYAGARLIALALATPSSSSPTITTIVTDVPAITAPAAALRSAEPPFVYSEIASAFTATVSSDATSQQIIVCRGMFTGVTTSTTRHYQFALLLNASTEDPPVTSTALAYKYIDGGSIWGVDSVVEVVWTIYLGTA